MVSKTADDKGRITLGPAFANTTLLVEETADGAIILRPAVTVPLREAWLFQNQKALTAVCNGIEQARNRQFASSPPNVNMAVSWVDELKD